MPKTRNGPTNRGASGALRQTGGAGNDPHQGALAEVARIIQETDARHEAAIKQTAANAAAAASESFSAQLRAILPPPALPRDGDAGFGPAAELDAAAQVGSAAAAPVTVAPWAAARVSPAAQGTAQVPPRPAETAELQIALYHLRNSLAAAPAGAAAAAAARKESQRADASIFKYP